MEEVDEQEFNEYGDPIDDDEECRMMGMACVSCTHEGICRLNGQRCLHMDFYGQ